METIIQTTRYKYIHEMSCGDSETEGEPGTNILPSILYDTAKDGCNRLLGKVALIEGGDTGLGRAIAVQFAKEGAEVAILFNGDGSYARETAGMILEYGKQALLLSCDATSEDGCKLAVDRTISKFGKIDILVNNAAQENIVPQYYLVNQAIPHLAAGSSIINTASDTPHPAAGSSIINAATDTPHLAAGSSIINTATDIPHLAAGSSIINTATDIPHLAAGNSINTATDIPHLATGSSIINTATDIPHLAAGSSIMNTSTQDAIIDFTRTLSSLLIKKGIRVNAVAPGAMWNEAMSVWYEVKGATELPLNSINDFGKDSLMGYAAQPADIAPCYIFLASEDAAFISGEVLHPNGGTVMTS
jgi:NAD(P)-dependent dehydrogenase (short-subunit alcohol dehydrogenase family)